jgi:ubiquinone/menaquinone biosynthesis C-methylase UbiE
MMNDPIEHIRSQFTRQAHAYATSVQASDEAAHARLVDACLSKPEDCVLDVACGPGFLTMAFARRCRRVVGIDATEAFLDLARKEAAKRGLSNIRFEQGLATDLPYTDATFDLVVCRAAFHHFPEPARVLAEMCRVVKPGGRVVTADFLTSENPGEARLHHEIECLCDPTHGRALTGTEFLELFHRTGLKIVLENRRRLHYDLDEWIRHGGPAPEAEAEIRRRFQAALMKDETGLQVRMEGDKIRFTHQTLLLMGERM